VQVGVADILVVLGNPVHTLVPHAVQEVVDHLVLLGGLVPQVLLDSLVLMAHSKKAPMN
jgi:hypothetical protein